MEIEAKFALPNRGTFQRLQAADHIAGFALSAHQIQQVRDTYLDTPGRLLLDAGYVCRCRELESRVLVTVKGLRRAEGAIHRREEIEISLPSYQPPARWPESPVRDLVLGLIGEAPLIPLFELHQTRVFRRMSQGELLVAELCLDKVRLMADGRSQNYLELEVELAPQGTEEDMTSIVAYLQDEWGLKPRHRSKFDRAMAFLDQASTEDLMTPQEHAVCLEIAKRDDIYGRRAEGLLALHAGTTQAEAAERAGRSARTVRRWVAGFAEERLGIFPDRVLREAGARAVSAASSAQPNSALLDLSTGDEEPASLPLAAAVSDEAESPKELSLRTQPELEPQPEDTPVPESLDVLFDRYGVDRAHARAVADHAIKLFEHLDPFHGLPPERRSVLETAALAHNIGLSVDPSRHHTVGRDILLSHPPEGLDEQGRLTVALTTFLHRKRMTPEKVEKKASKRAFANLTGVGRDEALALAALVRLADGLDYSQTGTSEIGQVRIEGKQAQVEVTGPYAAIDARRAEEKSDLWDLLSDLQLQFTAAGMSRASSVIATREEPTVEPPVELLRTSVIESTIGVTPQELPEQPGLRIEDTMAEAARKTFAFHFQRMLYHEPGTRQGEDIEELHDMRVATRRMRSAFPVFGDYLDMARLKPILKGLKRTGSYLGAVRDLDVFWEKTQRYLDGLPSEEQDDLAALRRAWRTERERMRERMLVYLDGDRYAAFTGRFAQLLETPQAWRPPPLTRKGEAVPHRLRHVVPMAVYERTADVLAYDEWVTQPDVPLERLHRLRIATKRLRYTLEFFEEVLAPQARDLIKEMKKLQDHLGDLQDAVVASELLRDFLTWGTWGHAEGKKQAALPSEPVVAPGVATYMASKQRELQQLLSAFPETWGYFQSHEFKQTVAAVVAPL
ncbi:MAG: CHAD domain-containing protein [Anaerolineae bacterium]